MSVRVMVGLVMVLLVMLFAVTKHRTRCFAFALLGSVRAGGNGGSYSLCRRDACWCAVFLDRAAASASAATCGQTHYAGVGGSGDSYPRQEKETELVVVTGESEVRGRGLDGKGGKGERGEKAKGCNEKGGKRRRGEKARKKKEKRVKRERGETGGSGEVSCVKELKWTSVCVSCL